MIRSCFEKREPMGPVHRVAMDALREYMIVGGMPQAVKRYFSRVLFGDITLNEGMLAENVVAQMLTTAGRKLYFFSRSPLCSSFRGCLDFRNQVGPIQHKVCH